MANRRLYHAPRGSLGVDLYSFQASLMNGLPRPLFCVDVTAPSTWATLTSAFEQALHASTNTVLYYQNFNNNWPTSTVSGILASGRSQIMTLSPITATLNLEGGVRQSDGGIDNPMVANTTYSGLVLSSVYFLDSVTQPNGTYITLSGAPNGVALAAPLVHPVTAGSQIAVTPFIASGNSTTASAYDLSGITAGNYDSAIQSCATSAAGTGLAIRFAHEMNGNWYPWGVASGGSGFTPSQYVSLWNHFRSVWQAQETSLSVAHCPWIWCPNLTNNKSGTPSGSGILTTGPGTGAGLPIYAPTTPGAVGTGNCFYPGDSNCEYIGLDGYSNPSGGNPSFASLYDNDIQWMQSGITTTKPMLIGETGVDVSIGSTARAAWFSGMFTTLQTYSVIGVSYFNNVGSGNYPINTDPVACMGFLSSLKKWVQNYN